MGFLLTMGVVGILEHIFHHVKMEISTFEVAWNDPRKSAELPLLIND
jgi:hypothetical protein